MGFSPRQIDDCSLWEVAAMFDGFAKANGAETPNEAPSDDEFEEALSRAGDAFAMN